MSVTVLAIRCLVAAPIDEGSLSLESRIVPGLN
jgi:hypothetical protein